MKPIASLSLDLDNKWSYLKTHGDAGWDAYPSYLDLVVPRILDFLKTRDLTITFFVVGQDAALEKNHDALRAIADAGHDIGNHSFRHEPWLHLYSQQELKEELARAEEHIERVTGRRPTGFRGPGFSLSAGTLDELARRGYRYDATVFPNLLNPLARLYFFMTSNLTKEERKRRKALFGTVKDALRPVTPFQWRLENGSLLEVPVTTMPLLKLPIHFSYVLYLSTFSPVTAKAYFRLAMKMCQWTKTSPSLLLHPLDFMGCEDDKDLSFFPAMGVTSDHKIRLLDWMLGLVAERYRCVTMAEQARVLGESSALPVLEPAFRL
jgi:hypothetical protein